MISVQYSALSPSFPEFTWVVQDFVQDLNGLTPTEWLRNFLGGHREQQQFLGGSAEDNILVKTFKSIHSHVLFLPSTDRDELRDLSQIEFQQLNSYFKQDLEGLKGHVLRHLFAKQNERQQTFNGPMLVSLLKIVTEAANTQSFPEVNTLSIIHL